MAIFKKTTVTTTNMPILPTATTVVQYSNRDSAIDKIDYLLYILLSFLEFFLLARLVLRFLNANQVGIVKFIYDVAAPFIQPFAGILGRNPQIGSGFYIEWETIIAAIFWALFFTGATLLINLFRRDS